MLIPPLIGAALRLLLSIAIVSFDLHPVFLILPALCDGIGGGWCGMLMAVFSYVASVTDTCARSTRIVVVEFSIGVSIVISELSIGYAIAVLGYAWTFVILLGVIFAALCYAAFVLSNVASPAAVNGGPVTFFTTKHFRRVLSLYVRDDEAGTRRHLKLRLMLSILILTTAVQMGRVEVQTLFLLSPPICFSAIWVGYFFAVSYFIPSLMNLVVTHIFVRHVGDLALIVVGLLFGCAYHLMFGLATNRTTVFLGKFSSLPAVCYSVEFCLFIHLYSGISFLHILFRIKNLRL